MTASTFDHAGGNRPAIGETGGVVHVGQIAFEVVSGLVELLPLGWGGLGFLSQLAKVGDDLSGFAGEHLQGMLGHPLETLVVGFTQEAIGNLPQILIGMNEIQFCIMMITALGVGFITPPLGLNLFVVSGITGESILKIAYRAIPFVFFMLLVTLLIAYVPAISTTLLPDIYK